MIFQRKKTLSMFVFAVLMFTFYNSGSAFEPGNANPSWTFTNRLTVTGLSKDSKPEGYKAYSSLGMNAGIRKNFTRHLAAELIVAKESREIDFIDRNGRETSLGSLDYLQCVIALQYHQHLYAKIKSYFGIGGNYNRYFEKSGSINPYRVPDALGFTAQLGLNVEISKNMLFNVDLRSNQMQAEISSSKHKIAEIHINPIAISFGLGFQF